MPTSRSFRIALLAALVATAACKGGASDSKAQPPGAAPAPAATSAPAPASTSTPPPPPTTTTPTTTTTTPAAPPAKRPESITADDADVAAKLATVMEDLAGAAEKNAADCDKAGDALQAVITKNRPIVDKAIAIDTRLKNDAAASAWFKATYASRLQAVVTRMTPLMQKCSSSTKVSAALKSISVAPTTPPSTPAPGTQGTSTATKSK